MMRLDPKLKLLAGIVAGFVLALFYCEHMFPQDGQMFQAVYGLLTGFSAILLNELRKELGQQPEDSTRHTVSDVTTTIPAAAPPAAVPNERNQ